MTIGTGRFLFDKTLRVLSSPSTLAGARSPLLHRGGHLGSRGHGAGEEGRPGPDRREPRGLRLRGGRRRGADPRPGPRGSSFLRDDELGLAYALGASGDAVKIALVRGHLRGGALLHWHPAERVAIVSLGRLGRVSRRLGGGLRGIPDGAAGEPAPTSRVGPGRRRARRHPGLLGRRRARPGPRPRPCSPRADLCPECRRIYEAAGVDVTTFLHFVGGGAGDRAAGRRAEPGRYSFRLGSSQPSRAA